MKASRTLARWGAVAVAGASMEPTYSEGDWLCVSWFREPQALTVGAIYVIEREDQPGVLYIKRLQKEHGGLAWFEGDNPTSQDSRSWGWLPRTCVRGKVLFRYRRARR